MPYNWTKNEDGTYNILDVEVFAEHERFGKKFDSAWMEQWLAKAQTYIAEGHKPPVHVFHHGGTPELEGKTPKVGYFKPTKIVEKLIGGKPTKVALADLYQITQPAFDAIVAEKLPYRSVEIAFKHFDDPFIDSLALLNSSAPHFKFPNLELAPEGSDVQAQPQMSGYAISDEFACYSLGGDAYHVNFAFGKPEDEDEDDDKQQPPGKQPPGSVSSPTGHEEPDGDEGPGAKITSVKVEGKSPAVAKAEAVAEIAKTLAGGLTELVKVLAAMDNGGNEPAEKPEGPDKNKDGVADEDESVVGGPVTMSAQTPNNSNSNGSKPAEAPTGVAMPDGKIIAYSEFAGKHAALEAKVARLEKQRVTAELVSGALADLKAYGITEESKAELVAIADGQGKEGVAAYVAAVKRYGTPDDAGDSIDGKPDGATKVTEPEHISKWAAKSPELGNKARKLLAMYEAAPDHMRALYTVEKYIDSQMAINESGQLTG